MKLTGIGPGAMVRDAIANAASATGTDFDFLMKTAQRESSFNPRAKAATSSASGLFQFIDSTWLNMVKRYGARHGLSNEAQMIATDSSGRSWVADPNQRRTILNLRFDPMIAAKLAGEFTRENATFLKSRIGREPDAGELYAAHFLGPSGAAQLVQTVNRSPDMPATALFPEAASANRSIFYDRDGSPRTVRGLVAELSRKIGGSATVSFDSGAEPTEPALRPALDGQALLLAQIYGASDAQERASVLQVLTSIFDGRSIADVLSPEDQSGSSGGLPLRGRF
jgi:hypothetical protein